MDIFGEMILKNKKRINMNILEWFRDLKMKRKRLKIFNKYLGKEISYQE